MSRANARSGIEDEYEEAKETARVYLEAVGVLGPDEDSTSEYLEPETRIPLDAIMQKTGVVDLPDDSNPDGRSTRMYRELETTIMRAAILGAVHFPNDPFAADAAYLGHRYLHRGSDSRILENLLEKDRTHPAYPEALTIIVHEMNRSFLRLSVGCPATGLDCLQTRIQVHLHDVATLFPSSHPRFPCRQDAQRSSELLVSGCAKPQKNGEQRIPLPAITGAGDDSERWVGV